MVQFLKVSGFPISADCSDDTSVVDKVDNYKSDLRFTTKVIHRFWVSIVKNWRKIEKAALVGSIFETFSL